MSLENETGAKPKTTADSVAGSLRWESLKRGPKCLKNRLESITNAGSIAFESMHKKTARDSQSRRSGVHGSFFSVGSELRNMNHASTGYIGDQLAASVRFSTKLHRRDSFLLRCLWRIRLLLLEATRSPSGAQLCGIHPLAPPEFFETLSEAPRAFRMVSVPKRRSWK